MNGGRAAAAAAVAPLHGHGHKAERGAVGEGSAGVQRDSSTVLCGFIPLPVQIIGKEGQAMKSCSSNRAVPNQIDHAVLDLHEHMRHRSLGSSLHTVHPAAPPLLPARTGEGASAAPLAFCMKGRFLSPKSEADT